MGVEQNYGWMNIQMKFSWQKIGIILILNLLLTVLLVPVLPTPEISLNETRLFDSGCTVIYGTNDYLAIGGNNEDYSDPATRIWFIPPEEGVFGRVLVGYEGFIWQGGMNDQGLFFDAMSIEDSFDVEQGNKEDYDGSLPSRALEICANVDCVLDLFNRYHAYDTWAFQFLFGDAEGNSVLIEPYTQTQGGEFLVGTNFLQSITNENDCRFCERYWIARSRFENADEISIELIRQILDETHLDGDYPTQYSTIYDLKEKKIYLYLFHNFEEVRVFDLGEELAKGYHVLAMEKLFDDDLDYYIYARTENFRQAEIRDDYQFVEPDNQIYDRYLGRYQAPEEMDAASPIYSVAYENGDLLLKLLPDKAWLKLEPFSETEFLHLSYFFNFEISFQVDENGNVEQFVYQDLEGEFTFNRVADAAEVEEQEQRQETFLTRSMNWFSQFSNSYTFKFLAIFLGLILLQAVIVYLRSLLA